MRRVLFALAILLSACLSWPQGELVGGYGKPVALKVVSGGSGIVSPGWVDYSALLRGYNTSLQGIVVLENNSLPVRAWEYRMGNKSLVYWNASPNTTYYVYAGEGGGTAANGSVIEYRDFFYLIHPPTRPQLTEYPWSNYYPYCNRTKDTSENCVVRICNSTDGFYCYGRTRTKTPDNGTTVLLSFTAGNLQGWVQDGQACRTGSRSCCWGCSTTCWWYDYRPYNATVYLDGELLAVLNNQNTAHCADCQTSPEEYPAAGYSFHVTAGPGSVLELNASYPQGLGPSCTQCSVPVCPPNTVFSYTAEVSVSESVLPFNLSLQDYEVLNRTLVRISCPKTVRVGGNATVILQNLGTEPAENTAFSGPGVTLLLSFNRTANITLLVSAQDIKTLRYEVSAFKEGVTWKKECTTLFYDEFSEAAANLTFNGTAASARYWRRTRYYFNHSPEDSVSLFCANASLNTSCYQGECITVQECSESLNASSRLARVEQLPGTVASFNNGSVAYARVFVLPNPLNESVTAVFFSGNLSWNQTIPAEGLEYQENLSGEFLSWEGPLNETAAECAEPGKPVRARAGFLLRNTAPFNVTASFYYAGANATFSLQANSTETVTMEYLVPEDKASDLEGYSACPRPEEEPRASSGGASGGGAAVAVFPAPAKTLPLPAAPAPEKNNSTSPENTSRKAESSSEPALLNESVPKTLQLQELPSATFTASGTSVVAVGDFDECLVSVLGKRFKMRPGDRVECGGNGTAVLSYECVKGNATVSGESVLALVPLLPQENRSGTRVTGAWYAGIGTLPAVLLPPAAAGLSAVLILLKRLK